VTSGTPESENFRPIYGSRTKAWEPKTTESVVPVARQMEPSPARLNVKASTSPGIAGIYASIGTYAMRLAAVECSPERCPQMDPPEILHRKLVRESCSIASP